MGVVLSLLSGLKLLSEYWKMFDGALSLRSRLQLNDLELYGINLLPNFKINAPLLLQHLHDGLLTLFKLVIHPLLFVLLIIVCNLKSLLDFLVHACDIR